MFSEPIISRQDIINEIRKWKDRGSPSFAPRISMAVCIVLSCISIAAGMAEGSITMKTNGWIAAIDVITSLLFISAVDRSVRSPDFNFNYGYGKYESLAVLISAGLLLLVLAFVIIESFISFGQAPETDNYNILIGVAIFSSIAMWLSYKLQKKYARRFDQPMLRFESEVWKMDAWMELGVLGNILAGSLLHQYNFDGMAHMLDSLVAILILLIALKVPLSHGREALNQLLDRTLSEDIQLSILAVIAENIDSFCEFNSVHTRRSGKDIFIEIDVMMPFDYSLEQAYEFEQGIVRSVHQRHPGAITRLYVRPCPRNCMRDGKCFCPVKNSQGLC
jgi:cation diffusion facilitator family transporter